MRDLTPSLKPSIKPWLFQVDSHREESFGHFLGRFRRANRLSQAQLSAMLGQRGYLVAYWESPSRQRHPSVAHLEQLSQLTGVDIHRFHQMWPASSIRLHWPTRLCPDCYGEAPWHRHTWQWAEQGHCDIHQRQLLSECPCCHSGLRLPSYWAVGECEYCRWPFVPRERSGSDLKAFRGELSI